MAELRIKSDEVKKKVEVLRQLNSQFKTKKEELEAKENYLRTIWEGESSDAFYQKFLLEKQKMENFHTGINDYATALYNMAEKHNSEELKNVQIANSL